MNTDRRPVLLVSSVILAFGAFACYIGCSDSSISEPYDPCSDCRAGDPYQVCYTEETCDEFGCEVQALGCVDTCTDRSSCDEGHDCVPYGVAQVCSLECDSALCGEGSICLGDTCFAVQCFDDAECGSGEFCHHAECFPSSGACNNTSCPYLAGEGLVACGDDGYCHFEREPEAPIFGLEADRELAVLRPRRSESFATEADVRIEWQSGSEAIIVLILDEKPTSSADVHEHAIWGLTRKAGEGHRARWHDGVEIVEGEKWKTAPASAPVDKPLYLLVQSVKEGRLVGISSVVPFIIGERSWAEPGDDCRSDDESSCENPARPQICLRNECRVLCASHRDCAELAGGLLCGYDPEPLVRTCVEAPRR